jgi:hypothetical protein
VPESELHRYYVDIISDWFFRNVADSSRYITFSANGKMNISPPPILNGSIPDFFARSPHTKSIFIGEAKTYIDLDNKHTTQQFSSYLSICSNNPLCEVIVAVPWTAVQTAKNIFKYLIKKRCDNICPKIHYIDNLPENIW